MRDLRVRVQILNDNGEYETVLEGSADVEEREEEWTELLVSSPDGDMIVQVPVRV